MKDRIFIYTNVLVYIHLFDEESQDKRKALQNLLHRRIDAELIINVQVINEFYNVLLRKNIEDNVIEEKIHSFGKQLFNSLFRRYATRPGHRR